MMKVRFINLWSLVLMLGTVITSIASAQQWNQSGLFHESLVPKGGNERIFIAPAWSKNSFATESPPKRTCPAASGMSVYYPNRTFTAPCTPNPLDFQSTGSRSTLGFTGWRDILRQCADHGSKGVPKCGNSIPSSYWLFWSPAASRLATGTQTTPRIPWARPWVTSSSHRS